MTGKDFKGSACENAVLFEIAHAVKSCELEMIALEDSMAAWVSGGLLIEQTPFAALQKLDHIKQMQGDLFFVLLRFSEIKSSLPQKELVEIDVWSLLQDVRLGEIRERLKRAATNYREVSSAKVLFESHQSDVTLFND